MFDGLLPEPHNTRSLNLLFIFAYWHRFAKLWVHTDTTLDILDSLTQLLGRHLRDFKKYTCSAYETRELLREANARYRRQSKKATMRSKEDGGAQQPNATQTDCDASKMKSQKECRVVAERDRQRKSFNLNTYKHHALGDVCDTIRKYGTTDSYSTEAVSFYRNSLPALTSFCIGRTRTSLAQDKLFENK